MDLWVPWGVTLLERVSAGGEFGGRRGPFGKGGSPHSTGNSHPAFRMSTDRGSRRAVDRMAGGARSGSEPIPDRADGCGISEIHGTRIFPCGLRFWGLIQEPTTHVEAIPRVLVSDRKILSRWVRDAWRLDGADRGADGADWDERGPGHGWRMSPKAGGGYGV